MQKLFFYTSLGCHLCEQAKTIAQPLAAELGLELAEVEIADSDELLEQYGVRIPVMQLEGSVRDLGWPFDERAARQYLSQ